MLRQRGVSSKSESSRDEAVLASSSHGLKESVPPSPASEAVVTSGKVDASSSSVAGGTAAEATMTTPKPAHRVATASLFSSDGPPSDFQGFHVLGRLLLILTNARLVVENTLKYGLLVNFHKAYFPLFLHDPYRWPNLLLFLGSGGFLVAAYVLEYAASKVRSSFGLAFVSTLEYINVAASIVVPTLVIWFVPSNEAGAVAVMFSSSIVFLKLVSFFVENKTYRTEWIGQKRPQRRLPIDKDGADMSYPHNLSVGNLVFFVCAPTLCYQLSYPRSERIRRSFLLKRVGELLFLLLLLFSIVQQYMLPTVENALAAVSQRDVPKLIERVLKLAVPNLYVFLGIFYGFFHLYLNIWAELIRFGDRRFYTDWWNSSSISRFWTSWNIPVHSWVMRYLYIPAVSRGASKNTGFFIAFLVSAIFHELILSVAFRSIGFFAFLAMMAQVPLSLISPNFFKKAPVVGNVVLWITLMIGQPMGVMLYYCSKAFENTGAPSN